MSILVSVRNVIRVLAALQNKTFFYKMIQHQLPTWLKVRTALLIDLSSANIKNKMFRIGVLCPHYCLGVFACVYGQLLNNSGHQFAGSEWYSLQEGEVTLVVQDFRVRIIIQSELLSLTPGIQDLFIITFLLLFPTFFKVLKCRKCRVWLQKCRAGLRAVITLNPQTS